MKIIMKKQMKKIIIMKMIQKNKQKLLKMKHLIIKT